MLHWHNFPIFNRCQVIRLFHFGLDFPNDDEIRGTFEELYPKKVDILINTCLEGTSLRPTASFELLCVKIGSRVWAVSVARNLKNVKGTRPLHTCNHVGRATAGLIPSKLGRVGVPWDILTHAKFEIERFIFCDFGTRLRLPILAARTIAINTEHG